MKVILFALFMFSSISFAEPEIRCGVAVGFPPYQYVNQKGEVTGVDVELAKLVFKAAGIKAVFVPGEWDFLISSLMHKTNTIDILVGAEVSDKRASLIDFSEPFYLRHTTMFVLRESPFKEVKDLYGKVVAGDRDSLFEKNLGERKNDIRIIKTSSKEESFNKLKEGDVFAVIAPELVGFHFGKELKMKIRTVGERDEGAPVAMAVKKGNKELLEKIDKALIKIKKSRKIDIILSKQMS